TFPTRLCVSIRSIRRRCTSRRSSATVAAFFTLTETLGVLQTITNTLATHIAVTHRTLVNGDQAPRIIARHTIRKSSFDLRCEQRKAGRDILAVIADILDRKAHILNPFRLV